MGQTQRIVSTVVSCLVALSTVLFAQRPSQSDSTTSSQTQQRFPGELRAVPIPPIDEETAKERRSAMELFEQGKREEALPLFEKVVAKVPNDIVAQERLGSCILSVADASIDPEVRKAGRVRARKEFLRAKELGDNSDLVSAMLAGPEDGSDPKFSGNADADRYMQEGERAFAANKFDEAKDQYLKALLINPNLYFAALFIGDVYFKKGDALSAGEWFARAIQINGDQETAYRYWGDVLLKTGKVGAARDKYIQAVICNPYDQHAWSGVNNYLITMKKAPNWRHIKAPGSVTVSGSQTNINLDPSTLGKNDGSSAWIIYPMSHALWMREKFKKEFPSEPQYRHTLKEESESLSMVADSAEALSSGKSGKPPEKLNDDLKFLVMLRKAGFLESYILITNPDKDITRDYPSYRSAHRDLLVRYLNEVVVPPAPTT